MARIRNLYVATLWSSLLLSLLEWGGCHPITINEVNSMAFSRNDDGGGRFVELKFTDFCLFKRFSNYSSQTGPDLDGYSLVFFDQGEFGLGSVHHIESLEGRRFKLDQPYFTVGFAEDGNFDVDLNYHNVTSSPLTRRRWKRISSKVLSSGGDRLQAIALVRSTILNSSLKGMIEKFTRGQAWLTRQSKFFWKNVQDLIYYGSKPHSECPFKSYAPPAYVRNENWTRPIQLYESDFPSWIAFRDFDAEFNLARGHEYVSAGKYDALRLAIIRKRYLDLSIGRCGSYGLSQITFAPELFAVANPTPGAENDCPGLQFIVEEEESRIPIGNSSVPSPEEAKTCNSQISRNLTDIQIALHRDRMFRASENQPATATPSCGKERGAQYHSYATVGEPLQLTCLTKQELKNKAERVLSREQAILYSAFLEDFSSSAPPASATLSDMLCWGRNVGSGAPHFLLGVVTGALAGNVGKFVKILDSLAKIMTSIGNISDFLSDVLDILDQEEDFNKNEEDKSPSEDESIEEGIERFANETTNAAGEIVASECSFLMSDKNQIRFKRAPTDCVCFFEGSGSDCGAEELAELESFERMAAISTEDVPYAYGTVSELDLMLSRTKVFKDWEGEEISAFLKGKYSCKKHRFELGKQWHKKKSNFRRIRGSGAEKLACQFPDVKGAGSHLTPISAMTKAGQWRYITREQSKVLLDVKGTFLPLGSAVCKRHSVYLSDLEAGERVKDKGYDLRPCLQETFADAPEIKPESAGAPPYASCSSEEPSTGSEYQPSQEKEEPAPKAESEQKRIKIQNLVRELGETAGINDVHFTNDFEALKHSTQTRRVSAAVRLTDVMINSFAEAGYQKMKKMVLSRFGTQTGATSVSQSLEKIVSQVVKVFSESKTKGDRLQALSLVAPFMTHQDLASHLPGLSKYMFTAARRHAAAFGPGKRLAKMAMHRVRMEKKKIESFVYFITSPEMIVDLPFGSSTLKYSSGDTEDIPSVIRMMANSRIVTMYLKYLEETNQQHLALSESTLLRILQHCMAKTRKSISGLDYVTHAGVLGFDSLNDLLDEMQSNNLMDRNWIANTKRTLLEMKRYLKVDYKVKLNSGAYVKVADHCFILALSDPKNQKFYATCDHEHDARCKDCDSLYLLLEEVRNEISDAKWSDERQAEVLHISRIAIDNILEWKNHQLRTTFLENHKERDIASLTESEIYLWCDWAMKFLPEYGTESSTAWFGKRGINWHICTAMRKEADDYLRRDFVHIFDQIKQDGATVSGLLSHIVEVIKTEVPEAKSIKLRSDNAGCYKKASLLASMPEISKNTGIEVNSWSFGETQSGKGPCDRRAADIKRHLRMYRDENHDISSANEFLTAASSYGGLRSTSFYVGSIEEKVAPRPIEAQEPPRKKKKSSKPSVSKIPGISLFHEFRFNYEESRPSLTVWRFPGIGPGEVISNHLWQAAPERTVFVPRDERSPAAGAEWTHTTTVYGRKSVPRKGESSEETKRGEKAFPGDESISADTEQEIFSCPVEGCISSFLKYGNLLNHLDTEKHVYRPENENGIDIALHLYSERTNCFARGYPTLLRDLPEAFIKEVTSESSRIPPLRMGWALEQPRTHKRFDEDVRAYLIEKYDEGERTGLKWNPADLELQMMREKMNGRLRFHPTQWLTWQKILSFFSRVTSQRRKSNLPTQGLPFVQTPSASHEVSPANLGEPEPGEEDIADITYLDDPDYPTPEDEIMSILMEQKTDCFLTDD